MFIRKKLSDAAFCFRTRPSGPTAPAADDQPSPESDPLAAAVDEKQTSQAHARPYLKSKVSARFRSPAMTSDEPNGKAEPETTAKPTGHSNGIVEAQDRTPDRPQSASRATSSKIAGLLAAFEKDGPERAASPRRTSSRQSSVQRNADQDAELARTRHQLAAETELRTVYECKVTSLEEEVEKLMGQLRERDGVWEREFERKNEALVVEKARAVEEMKEERWKRVQLLSEKGELEEALEKAEGEREEMKSQCNELRRKARRNGSPAAAAAATPVNGEANKALLHAEGETRTLKSQLTDLKRSISVSTRVENEVSDGTFVQEMGRLQHEVQNWVVNNFRRAKLQQSYDEICKGLQQAVGDDPPTFEASQSMYQTFEAMNKLAIFQATVVAILHEVFTEPYLYGLRQGDPWADSVRQSADALSSVMNPVAYNKWRSSTFDALRHTPAVEEHVNVRATQLAGTALNFLETATGTERNENGAMTLKQIVKRAISLAHLFRVQRAHYHFDLPSPGQSFEADGMEDVAIDAEEDVQRVVVCAIFPSVVKIGNGQDSNAAVRNVVVRSKVLCSEGG
ncbi:hypothetical protein MBLNU230_g8460t1 [Neophaeotheca triangularis]